MRRNIGKFFIIFAVSAGLVGTARAQVGFQGPPAGSNPPSGGGLFGVDAERNVRFGTGNITLSDTLQDGSSYNKVFILAENGNTGLGVQSLSASGRRYMLVARDTGRLVLRDGTAGAVRLFIESDGKVGIGGAGSALSALHVFGDARANNFIGNVQARYVTSDVFGGGSGNFAFPAALGVGTSNTLTLPTNGLYVAGNVGIGDTSPEAKLDVIGDVHIDGALNLQNNKITNLAEPTASTDAATKGYVDSSGIWTKNGSDIYVNAENVGIGTATPQKKLHVYTADANDGIKIESTNTGAGKSLLNDLNIESSSDSIAMWRFRNDADFWSIGIDGSDGDSFKISDTFSTNFPNAEFTITQDGNVGIGNNNPQFRLDVAGGGRFTEPVIVGTPSADDHAATVSYVNTVVSGGGGTAVSANSCGDAGTPCTLWGANVQNRDITNVSTLTVNKLNVQTIDPVYTIGDVSYATYVSDTIGLKMEHYGKARLTIANDNNNGIYKYTIDFKNTEEGSDLWLFWQTIDEGEGMEDVVVSLTPNFRGSAWYELDAEQKQIVLYGAPNEANEANEAISYKLSFHLVAPRHDAEDWPTLLKDPETKGVIIVPR